MKNAYFVSFHINFLCLLYFYVCVFLYRLCKYLWIWGKYFFIIIFLAIFIKYNILREEDEKEIKSEIYK